MTDAERQVLGLNELIALDFDAVEAYQAAIERLKDRATRKALTAFKRDHLRHTRELAREVRSLGGTPAKGPDFQRVLTKGLVVLARYAGDRMILRAMRMNEDRTNQAYAAALRLRSWPSRLRLVLQRNLEDERRHRAWITARLKGQALPLPTRKARSA